MKRKWRGRGPVLLALFCLALLLFWQPGDPGRRPVSGEAAPVRCELLAIRREVPLFSPAAGRLELLVREGERVAAGQPVVRIWPILGAAGAPETLTAPSPGVVCLTVDGLESVLTPETWAALRPEGLAALSPVPGKRADEGKRVDQGEPLLKLVDNLGPLLLIGSWPAAATWQPAVGTRVEVRSLASRQGWLAARVVASEGRYLGLEVRRWTPDWLAVRRLAAEVRGKR